MKNINSRLKPVLFGISTVIFAACSAENSRIKKLSYPEKPANEQQFVLDKLVGTWKSEDGKSFERWRKNSDGTYQSVVYSLKGKDTIFMEKADIYKNKDQWIFENIVSGQNEGKTVKFTSVAISENTVQFSNPEHDFPNNINYTLPDANTVNAFITGENEKGGTDTIPFNYSRIR